MSMTAGWILLTLTSCAKPRPGECLIAPPNADVKREMKAKDFRGNMPKMYQWFLDLERDVGWIEKDADA